MTKEIMFYFTAKERLYTTHTVQRKVRLCFSNHEDKFATV